MKIQKILNISLVEDRQKKIQLGVETGKRINVKQLEKCFSFAAEFIPDPRNVIDDAAYFEKELKNREKRKRREKELALKI